MADQNQALDITPYLNPNYWDGHTLGFGETQESLGTVYHYPDSKYARATINSRVRSTAIFPLQSFERGDVFNPAGYEPGTVVLFRQEILAGEAVEPEYSVEELALQVLPLRETRTSPSFGSAAPRITNMLTSNTRHYNSEAHWGVVGRDNRKNYLSSTPARNITERGLGVRTHATCYNIDGPIIIGETVHTPATKSGGDEQLRRVNILHLIAYGELKRQKRQVFNFAGRIAFNGTV